MAGDEVVRAAFLVAMARSARCASTLRSTWIGEVTQNQFKAFKRVLSCVTDWTSVVEVVVNEKKK